MARLLNRIGLTTWKRRILALFIIAPVLGITSVEVTSQSWFCDSCHIMNPYYDSWARGTHKDVECIKCHISPGVDNFVEAKLNGAGQVVDDILHRTSMKPSASVSALSCTRSGCHDVEKLKPKAIDAGAFKFRHDKHLGLDYQGIAVACTTCHAHVKGDQHFEIQTNVCVTCHLVKSPQHPEQATPAGPAVADAKAAQARVIQMAVRDGRVAGAAPAPTSGGPGRTPPANCQTCHDAPKGTIERGGLRFNHADYLGFGASCDSCHRGNTAAPVPIDSGMCYGCHTFGLERLTDVKSMHATHTQGRHKIECFSCHGTVHHGPATQTARLDQLDCRQCHADQHGVQRTTYLHRADAGAAVSPMFMAHVDCTGCHVERGAVSAKPDSGATVAKATPEACDACHKPGYGRELVGLWQKTTRGLYDALGHDIDAAEASATGGRARELLAEARRTRDLVRVDGSWGVHNPKYTQELIEQARRKAAEAREGAGRAAGAEGRGS